LFFVSINQTTAKTITEEAEQFKPFMKTHYPATGLAAL
jgi:hypothetical protein